MRLTEMVSSHDARIRWGILSTGHIASVLTRDLALLPDEAEVVAVGSRSLDKAEQFAREYQIPRAYGSYAELAADPEVDVIYVASTHNDHLGSATAVPRGRQGRPGGEAADRVRGGDRGARSTSPVSVGCS